jgi:hypothetical protein
MNSRTSVPRPKALSRNSIQPSWSTSDPSLEVQAIRSPGTSSVIWETSSTSIPPGPAMVHCDRPDSRISTDFTFSMKLGRLVMSLQ